MLRPRYPSGETRPWKPAAGATTSPLTPQARHRCTTTDLEPSRRPGQRRLHGLLNPVGHRLGILVLPEAKNRPPALLQVFGRLRVPLDVAGDLVSPEPGVGGRLGAMVWASVPEAAVDEHRDPGPAQDEIRGAGGLGCSWHPVSNAVQRWGSALPAADTARVSAVAASGLDEHLMWRRGRFRARAWATSIADAGGGQLLDIVAGRTARVPKRWLLRRPRGWLAAVRWAVLDLSGPCRSAFNETLPHAPQVADPFPVVGLGNDAFVEVRRRVRQQTLAHRGRKHDPLYRARKLLVTGRPDSGHGIRPAQIRPAELCRRRVQQHPLRPPVGRWNPPDRRCATSCGGTARVGLSILLARLLSLVAVDTSVANECSL